MRVPASTRRPVLGALLLGLAAVVVGGAPATSETAADVARELTIAASGIEPAALKVRRGDLLRLDVGSGDGAEHCFALDELRIERRVVPGRKTRVDLVPARAGRFAYYCCLHATAAAGRERGELIVSD